jgi:PilZ domain
VRASLLNDGRRVDPSGLRRLSRIRLQVPVFLRGIDSSGNEFIELTKTLNISATGACLASTRLLRAAQIVNLTFPAPSSLPCAVVPNETPPISAKVLRQGSAGEIRLIGLEFLKPLE